MYSYILINIHILYWMIYFSKIKGVRQIVIKKLYKLYVNSYMLTALYHDPCSLFDSKNPFQFAFKFMK